ncbi:sulfatase [Halobacteriales archaeon QS_6_64_34]|nr:MAG: sulfatase [Halobacteriales archaeon QS_6_64_34]
MTDTSSRDDPNIVLFVMDTMRAGGTVPADPALTPNLAALAASGAEYTNTFATAPWTLPSHVSLFTGTYPSKHGACGDHTYFDGSLPTIVDAFADAGYETAGVSNNVWITDEFGATDGFDVFRDDSKRTDAWSGAGGWGHRATNAVRRSRFGGPTFEWLRRHLTVGDESDNGAAATVDWAAEWLADRDSDDPFFFFANCIEPHLEYRPPPSFARDFLPDGWSYDRAMSLRQDPREFDVGAFDYTEEEWDVVKSLYHAEIAYLDAQVGRLQAVLEAAGEWEDTVFVALSDHGENVGEHGLLGHQYSLFDTVLHVPLVVHGGDFSANHVRTDRLVQTADLAPTLLDAAGIDAPELREASQALSFHPTEGTEPRSQVIAEYMRPQPAIEVLEEKFDHVPDELYEYQRSLRAVRTNGYKYVRGSDGTEWLYDVREDPGERHDISAASPRQTADLATALDTWLGSFDEADTVGSVEVSDATEDRLADLGYL